MIPTRFARVAILLPACFFAFMPRSYSDWLRDAKPAQSSAANPQPGTVVYVSDFELDICHSWIVMRPSPRPPTSSTAGAASPTPAGGSPYQPSQTCATPEQQSPRANPPQTSPNSSSGGPQRSSIRLDPDEEIRNRANELVNGMAENVVSALQRNGYEAYRLRRNQPRPDKGLLIRGVFAESDDQNRARRLLFGGPSTSPKMILYIGVNNLKNSEQPLYELANPPAPDSRYGPVITVTSYSPAARFELAKKPSDDEIKDIASQIAAGLSALLSANPLMSAQ